MVFDNDHCNNCYKPILWLHPVTHRPEIHPKSGKKRPLNQDGSLHLCMHKGQSDFFFGGKKKPRDPSGGSGGYWYTDES